jgi:hypothetical protein
MGIQRHTAVENSDQEIPVVQQIRERELALENWSKKTLQRFEVIALVLRSVAKRRLVETANPSACTTV